MNRGEAAEPINAAQRIRGAASSWEGVTTRPHRFGGIEFRLGKKELGHIHGNHLLDIPFPLSVRNELVAAGEVHPHHFIPESGWVSFPIAAPGDVDKALLLLRRSYEIALRRSSQRTASAP